jgi:hypothetical protein
MSEHTINVEKKKRNSVLFLNKKCRQKLRKTGKRRDQKSERKLIGTRRKPKMVQYVLRVSRRDE